MTTNIKENYTGVNMDAQENFHGNQLIYIGWDKHLMFCAPICVPMTPEAPFAAIVQEVLPGAYGQHPDFEKIDWSTVEWSIDQSPAKPDMDKSLVDNGITHKSLIRFVTPNLNGINGASS